MIPDTVHERDLKRIQLFEFEDFNWLPNPIRSGITNLLRLLHRLIGTADVLADLLVHVQQKVAFTQITDLGSGSGGPMLAVMDKINEQDPNITLLLSDKYPNPEVVNRINAMANPSISYAPQSVDASRLDQAPVGLKTMVASFHHMPSEIARKILVSAEENREPLLIYEIAENTIPLVLWWLLLPLSLGILILMALVMTLFVRPLTISQVFFTYLVPIIPLIYAWDGQASLVRTYTLKDIERLLGQRTNSTYHWEVASATKPNGKKAGYYVLGYPLK